MKILQINSVCGTGSTGRICTDLADIAEAHGHECMVAYGRGTAPEKYRKKAVRIGSEIGVRFHALHSRIFDDSGFRSHRATRKFVKWIGEYDPDIIHLHNIHGYYINVKILFDYLKIAGKPVVWTFHDCWAFTGHCAYFATVNCRQWRTHCVSCIQKSEYPKSILKDNSKLNFSGKKDAFTGIDNLTVVTPSKWLACIVRMSFMREYPIKVINNGIDLSLFKPSGSNFRKKYGLEDKKIILGVANIWNRRKGFNDFIKISELVDDDHIIVLVGLREKQISELPQNMLGISRTDDIKELVEIYNEADVFVNPTHEDNFPTVNIEAQACGVPVVTYDTGGSSETVAHSNGMVVQSGNIAELLEKIITVTNKASKETKTVTQYDKQQKYSEYLKLFSDIS